jgi:hypothetical protein
MGMPTDKDARKFARVAKQRLEEARTIHAKVHLSAAAEYLGGYAVECVLKALLLVVTPPQERSDSGQSAIEWLKKEFGHDLALLRFGLDQRGTRMPANVAKQFVFVSTWDPQSRYEPGPGDPERAERFLAAAGAIVAWADGRM